MNASGDLLDEVARAHRYRWTHSDELLALLLERLDGLANLIGFALTDKAHRPRRMPKPYRYTRPFPQPKPKPSTISEIRRFFGRR